ncbi:hypothetical protein [Serratia phage vB_SmaS_Opt-169]|uniref:Uncharacterized protein n=1 Tax=Serratia phage vB_SmaS_Rovert TaxID=2777363 RepID=A0A7T3TKW9_9CAUD|nr:hypothetical protein QJS24_gp56 [Serratia phage vB_SmaS_Rovert]QPX75023.1 hypothetical protein [Serratia phage vB_SmaS_Rovert]QPX75413.1 hypothetical protein [Serratia phage vB_SmaS_Opt-169]UGO51939.1 hypothetical protein PHOOPHIGHTERS_5 [Serratia phage vB_SmaS_PhooPhighters]
MKELEDRYIVVKKTDVEDALKNMAFTEADLLGFYAVVNVLKESRAFEGKQDLTGIFVESDWPCFETVKNLVLGGDDDA